MGQLRSDRIMLAYRKFIHMTEKHEIVKIARITSHGAYWVLSLS